MRRSQITTRKDWRNFYLLVR